MFAKKPGKHIVKLVVTVNLDALPDWLQTEVEDVPIVPFSEWQQHRTFVYPMFRLPVAADKNWYFHKNAAEYSHSCNAIIDLASHFDEQVNNQSAAENGTSDLELRLWRGQMSIGFNGKLILVAPLTEMITITDTGKTSRPGSAPAREQTIEVPIGFDKGQATAFMSLYEAVDSETASYSNQLIHFTMKAATDSVRC